MAATQNPAAQYTVGGQQTDAAAYVTIPSGATIESITVNNGGSPQFEDYYDADGAHKVRITFEARMHTATVVLVGKAYTKAAGEMDGSSSNYYIESCSKEVSKGPVRTTITVTRIPGVA
jgi:hypothetical protein